jgi:hypothetical protein
VKKIIDEMKRKNIERLDIAVFACNPSYSEGGDWMNFGLKLCQVKNKSKSHFNKQAEHSNVCL